MTTFIDAAFNAWLQVFPEPLLLALLGITFISNFFYTIIDRWL